MVTSDRHSTQMTQFYIAMQNGAEKSNLFPALQDFYFGIMIDDLSSDPDIR